jgi:hypothetical protein
MEENEKLRFLQKEINHLAYDTFAGIAGYKEFSVPCIPRISPQYLKNRFVLLAQETDTWYPNWGHFQEFSQSKYAEVEKILYEERYDDFSEWAASTYPGAFWEFTRSLYENGILEAPLHEKKWLSHCWMNLFCIEKCKDKKDDSGRPSRHIELAEKVMNVQKNLVFQILKLIKPRIILATTGHANDCFLLKNALGTDRSQVEFKAVDNKEIYEIKHITEIEIYDEKNPLHGVKILRTYHPNFFSKRINRRDKMVEIGEKVSNMGLSKAAYYQQVLFEVLKKWVS